MPDSESGSRIVFAVRMPMPVNICSLSCDAATILDHEALSLSIDRRNANQSIRSFRIYRLARKMFFKSCHPLFKWRHCPEED